jgi:hypothetical protein
VRWTARRYLGPRWDLWQADEAGFYDVQQPGIQPLGNGRACSRPTHTAGSGFAPWCPGRTRFPSTVRSVPCWPLRVGMPTVPAHVHFIAAAEGYQPVTTHIFVRGLVITSRITSKCRTMLPAGPANRRWARTSPLDGAHGQRPNPRRTLSSRRRGPSTLRGHDAVPSRWDVVVDGEAWLAAVSLPVSRFDHDLLLRPKVRSSPREPTQAGR